MTISVESFNGTDIQNATYEARLDLSDRPFAREARHVAVRPTGRNPVYVRGQVRERSLIVHVTVKADINNNLAALEELFSVGSSGALVVSFDGSNRVLDCAVRRHIRYDRWPNQFSAVLIAYDPLWREENATLEVDTINTSGDTFGITNPGNAREDRAVFRVRPSNLKEGSEDFRYYTEVIIANRVDRPYFEPIDVVENAWNHSGEVGAGRSQADGDDIRVLVDGVIEPHWADGLNTTTAKLWINGRFGPGVEVRLASAITAGSPANGDELDLETNDADGLPETNGHVVWGDELIKYTSKERSKLLGVTRGARGTTAASHSAGDVGYWVQRRVQVMYGYTAATAPIARDELQPMIDLASSLNTSWVWNNFAHETDPRSAQWERDLVSRDAQAARILLPSGEPMASVVFEYQEDGPESGKPSFNTLRKSFPSGLANGGGGNALSFTREIDDSLALKVIGRDNDGNEEELSSESGEVASGTLNIGEPAEPVFEVELYARSQVIEGNPPGTQELGHALATSFDGTAQQFTATEDVEIVGWLAKIGGTLSRLIDSQLMADNADAPGAVIASAAQVTTDTGGAGRLYAMLLSTPVQLIAGEKYWISFHANATDANLRYVQQTVTAILENSGVAQTNQVAIFRILSRDATTATIRAIGIDGDQVTIDSLTATLDSAKVPYVNQLARADAYWLDGTLRSETTGQELTFQILCELNDDIEVDVGNRTVTNITADEPADYGLEASDPQNWIYLEPGVNTLRWTEENLDQVVIDTDHFGRWH